MFANDFNKSDQIEEILIIICLTHAHFQTKIYV